MNSLQTDESSPASLEQRSSHPGEAYGSLGRTKRERALASIQLIWKRRRMLFQIMACGLIVGSVLAWVLPRTFLSVVTLMPPDSQAGAGMARMAAMAGVQGPAAAMAGDLLGVHTSGALYIGMLQSRTIADRIIDQFGLQQVYGVRLRAKARSKLQEHTFISEDRKTGLITISVSDRDPARAARIAQAYAEKLDGLLRELNTSSAHLERVFLEERLRAVKSDLDTSNQALATFSSQNRTLDIKEQGRAMVNASATVEGQLIAAKTQLEGLRQVYAEDNVRTKEARARVSELQNQLGRISGSGGTTSKESESQGPFPSLRNLPLLGVAYADLYRKTTIAETVYAALSQQFELAKVQEAKETPTIKVLDPAIVAERSSGPPRLTIICLSILLSFMGSVAWILGMSMWREADPHGPLKGFLLESFHQIRVTRKVQ
jgi:capsule polysaccharide export protein KpsE/RkpR